MIVILFCSNFIELPKKIKIIDAKAILAYFHQFSYGFGGLLVIFNQSFYQFYHIRHGFVGSF